MIEVEMGEYKIGRISDYAEGWVCGQFFEQGKIERTHAVEVKFGTLNPGDTDPWHRHPIGKEIVLIINGMVRWKLDGNEHTVKKGDVVYITNIEEKIVKVLSPTEYIAIRTPSVPNNKILLEDT
jgi:quercetin dioxygenase-like cupin family protein